MGNMYGDSVKQWNVIVGCRFNCTYCKRSFQAQMKRQKHNCQLCYEYEPHFHENRLNDSLPRTHGDEFIWACSSGDISFAAERWVTAVLDRIRELENRTFFIQSKDPRCFYKYDFPENVILGITLETNRDDGYESISHALPPSKRARIFAAHPHDRKIVTVEPIQQFDFLVFFMMIRMIHPMRIYVGYDTKKSGLYEPPLRKVKRLCEQLDRFTTVKRKLLRERHSQTIQKLVL